jgi:hypothetical protein
MKTVTVKLDEKGKAIEEVCEGVILTKIVAPVVHNEEEKKPVVKSKRTSKH